MTTTSRKIQGPWKQGLYQESVTATEIVGTVREDQFGRKFAYAKAGATALDPGKMTTAPLFNADWVDNNVATSAAIGATQVTMTIVDVGASDGLPKDYFRGGQLQVNDATGEGFWYPIIHSEAIINTQTSFTVTLAEPLVKAITATTTQVTPVPSPYMATVISGTETHNAVGTPLIDVTAAYYYWSQIAGVGVYYSDDTPAAGSPLTMSDEDGQLMARVLDMDNATNVTDVQVIVAIAYGVVGVDIEYRPCIYCIG